MMKILDKFYDIVKVLGKRNFILIIFIFIVLMVTGLYQTFSIYTESEGLSIVDGIKTYSFILNANNTTNTVAIAAGESKNIDITVYNESVVDLQYKLYSSIGSDVNDSDVYIGYLTNTANLPEGVIPAETSYVVTLKVYNYSANDITIDFGVLYGFEDAGELTLNSGQYEIEVLTLMKTLFANDTDYTYFRNYTSDITDVYFVDLDNISGDNSPDAANTSEIWNISANGSNDDSVVAWIVEDEDEIEGSFNCYLYIGAKEKIYVEDLQSFFSGMTALTNIDFTNLDTGLTTGMERLFKECTSLTSLDVSSFNTSNVTSMLGMFYNCSGLTSLNVTGIDTSNVTNMFNMFSGCSGLTSLFVGALDTSNVTNMAGMFCDCSSLTSLSLSNFDTSNVTNMNAMFAECSSLISLNLESFDTSNVTNMEVMFKNMSKLHELIFNEKSFATNVVTTMQEMFSGCSSLTNLDLSIFVTDNVTDMSGMFRSCISLTSLDVSSFNTGQVTTMRRMFHNCISLTELDLSNFDTSNVEDMSYMFYNDINGGDEDDVSKLTSINLSSFNTSKVTSMFYMFYCCNSLTSLNLSSFNTSNVTNMGAMFDGCSSLESLTLDLDSFDTSNVTNFNLMFYNCSKLSTEIVIRSTISGTPTTINTFSGAGTGGSSNPSITIYYTSTTQTLVNTMVGSNLNIKKELYTGTA